MKLAARIFGGFSRCQGLNPAVIILRWRYVMDFTVILTQVLILFIILFVGFLAGRSGIIDSIASKKLSELLMYVTAPMLVLNGFFIEFTKERLIMLLWLIGFSIIMFALTIFLAKLIYMKFPDNVNPVLQFTAIFSNCGYMGIPMMKALYGEEGVFYGSFYLVIFNILLWSYGFVLFGGKGSKWQVTKKILTNPTFIAVYIGLVVFFLGIKLPKAVTGAVSAMGDMTMPLSMLIIGAVMSTVRFDKIFTDWRAYLSSFVRLVLMPLAAVLLAKLLRVPELPAAIVVTALTMPSAAATTIFAEMYDKDSAFASKCVSISTLFSIVTAPLILFLL